MLLDGTTQLTGTAGMLGAAGSDSPTTGTQQSTNVIDLAVARDLAIGDETTLHLIVRVTATFVGGTSLQVMFQGAPDNGGVPGTYSTYMETAAIPEAALTIGTTVWDISVPRPNPGAALPRFWRLQYVTVGTHTAGSIYGMVVLDREVTGNFRSGIVVTN